MHRAKTNGTGLWLVLTVCAWLATRSEAATVPSGDTSVGTYTYVGKTGIGSLRIDGGTYEPGNVVLIGYAAGAQGTAVVNGAGTRWSVSSDFTVGYSGLGSLLIDAGGQVNAYNFNGTLGYFAGSSGSAVVTGANSLWSINKDLIVGRDGDGTLTISNGGKVTARTLYASMSSLSGDGTITVSGGAVLDADLLFDATHGTTQSLGFGTGGTLTLTVASSSTMGVGYKQSGAVTIAGGIAITTGLGQLGQYPGSTGTATVTGPSTRWNCSTTTVGERGSGILRIETGATVSSSYGYVGKSAGSIGAATLSGAGATWQNTSNLYVGNDGAGTLLVEGGAQVTAVRSYIGNGAGATGTATVTGAGSTWANSSDLYVGYQGAGALTVSDNATVTAKTIYASMTNLTGDGTITASAGAVLDMSGLLFDAAHPATQVLNFGTGGRMNLTAASTGSLGVGYKGTGTMEINGVAISSAFGRLGLFSGADGSATVSGAAGQWRVTSLEVGSAGTGALSLVAGGKGVSSDVHLGVAAGAAGTVSLGGSTSRWDNSETTFVGENGTGSLMIGSGGVVTSKVMYVGSNGNSVGMVSISGTGSQLLSTLSVGRQGRGTMTIADAGRASSSIANIGEGDGSNGEVTVRGGSTWSTGTLYVGNAGAGVLRIESGSTVSATSAYINNASSSMCEALVSGAGSNWTVSGSLQLGPADRARLTVSDGGSVSTAALVASLDSLRGNGTIATKGILMDGMLTFDATHSKTQSVPIGTGGQLNLNIDGTNILGAGYKGQGRLLIADGVSLTSTDTDLGYSSTAVGSATVLGAKSKWTITGALEVGHAGVGDLRIESGGTVSSWISVLGEDYGARGTVTVTGAGSRWNDTTKIHVGYRGRGVVRTLAGGRVVGNTIEIGYNGGSGEGLISGAGSTWFTTADVVVGRDGVGSLTVADGGALAVQNLSVNSQSAVRLHVSRDNMITVGNLGNPGGIINNGLFALYAGVALPAGVYRPFAEYSGEALSLTGNSFAASGGVWNAIDWTFTVSAPTQRASGQFEAVESFERIVFTDPATSRRVGVAFGGVSAGATIAGAPTGAADLASLSALLGPDQRIADGWDFTSGFAGGEVLLSFDLGPGMTDISVWRFSGGVWTRYTPATTSYSSDGIVSFTVTGFSGYAVIVPEPTSLGALLVLATACVGCTRTGRKKVS